jgi:two-component system response regulator DctR
MGKEMFRVILIEDDPMVQEVNRQFVERVEGFKVVGIAGTGMEGLKMVQKLQPDLVILDIYMPQLDGIETLQRLRTEMYPVDVIVITAAKDTPTIQKMLRNGAIDYIIKPFKFERVKQSLENFRQLRAQFMQEQTLDQAELDRLLQHKEGEQPLAADFEMEGGLPKGLNVLTLKQIMIFMLRKGDPLSAEEVADGVGIARVTARRYLEYLGKEGKLTLDIRYGGVGRPINRYKVNQSESINR